ncbi:ABC-three component system protein [Enterococcus faecalis]
MERNQVILELQKRYAEMKLIPFIGAGLSVPFSLPTWSALINDLKDLVPSELWPAIELDLEREDYQIAVDDIKKYSDCGEQVIQERIADTYGIPYITDSERPDSNYRDLISEGFHLYLTTNYDKVLEWYLPDANFYSSLTEYKSNTQRLFSGSKKSIFHLHGSVSNPNSIVISSESYENLYRDNSYDDLMKAFSSSHSYLFVGFSFSDIFIKELLKKHKGIYRGNHYLIALKDSIPKRELQRLNEDFGIKVIEYDISNSTHIDEIRKIINEITQIPGEELLPSTESVRGTHFEELSVVDSHATNLFYKKLMIADIKPELRDLSTLFYITAEKFIRESMKLGFPKEYIDEILVEVFLRYKEKYTVLYDIQQKDSNELLIAIHEDLSDINIDRFRKSENFNPMASETQGMIHVLADDSDKNVWWGNERFEKSID